MKFSTSVRTLLVIGVMPLGCSTTPPASTPEAVIQGEQTVHCLLPAQVRKLGGTIYPARRQLVFESETRCTLRGGEYTVYDRATASSSAEFYRALAEAGDAEAQYSLGLVYESLYSPARYTDAAAWYQRAASQQHAGAQKNLSFLYEQGLGVPQDSLMAINLLRQSGGIADDLVMTSQMEQALSAAAIEVQQLSEALESQNAQTSDLKRQLASVSQTLRTERQTLADTSAALDRLRSEKSALTVQAPTSNDVDPEAERKAQALALEIANKERMVVQQQRLIDSLSADLTAQQAQLQASERKASLREAALQDQIAAVRSQAEGSGADAAATLAARDAQIRMLTNALAVSQQQAASNGEARLALLAQLDREQRKLGQSANATAQLTQTLEALSAREQTIAEQRQRIDALREAAAAQNASTGEIRALRDQVATLKNALAQQELGYTALELELEAAQRSVVDNSDAAATELGALLAQVDEGAEALSRQQQRMAELEAQAAEAERIAAELTAGNEKLAEEQALAKAQLVAAETELSRVQALMAQLESELADSRSRQQLLLGENERLEQAIDDASESDSARIEDLQAQLSENVRALRAQAETIGRLEREMAAREDDFVAAADNRGQLLATRSIPQPVFPMVPDIELGGGKRYALVIGNDAYEYLNDLKTAVNGARAIDGILKARYGFETTLLLNASRRETVVEFRKLQQKLEPEDQVIIYYAGHGERSAKDPAITYWLPVDAQEDEMSYAADGINSTWITNEIRAMKAKHVMIVADSCYAGAMVRPVRVAVTTRTVDERRLKWMTKRRSRTVLTSGGNRPVLDESLDGTHSIFTQALVDVLSENPGVIYGEALHAALVQLVSYNARQFNFDQKPRFSEVADAGHGNGQFVMKSI